MSKFLRAAALAALLTALAVSFVLPARASGAAEEYLHARHAVNAPVDTRDQLVRAQTERLADAGQIYEITARVAGRIGFSGVQMLILDLQGVSLEVNLPSSLAPDAPWLDTGSLIRALVQASPDSSAYQAIAVAPEASVKDLEDQYAQAHQLRAPQASERTDLEPSRSSYYTMRAGEDGGGHPIAPLSEDANRIYPAYRAMIAGLNPRLSAHEIDTITTSILYYSSYYRIDPRLIIAMIVAESGFNPGETSHTGAMGLGQLMPETAASLGVTNAYDPVQNIGAAVQILSSHVQQYGGAAPSGAIPLNTLLLTMAAYNAGSGAVKKFGGVPPYRETQNYVRRVNRLYRQLCGG